MKHNLKSYCQTQQINCVFPGYKCDGDLQRNLRIVATAFSTSFKAIQTAPINQPEQQWRNNYKAIEMHRYKYLIPITCKFFINENMKSMAKGIHMEDCFRSICKERFVTFYISAAKR